MLAMDQGVVEEWLSEFKVLFCSLCICVPVCARHKNESAFVHDLHAVHSLAAFYGRIYFTRINKHAP